MPPEDRSRNFTSALDESALLSAFDNSPYSYLIREIERIVTEHFIDVTDNPNAYPLDPPQWISASLLLRRGETLTSSADAVGDQWELLQRDERRRQYQEAYAEWLKLQDSIRVLGELISRETRPDVIAILSEARDSMSRPAPARPDNDLPTTEHHDAVRAIVAVQLVTNIREATARASRTLTLFNVQASGRLGERGADYLHRCGLCYICGLFSETVLMCGAVIEQQLEILISDEDVRASEASAGQPPSRHVTHAQRISAAVERKLIAPETRKAMLRLKEMRNSVAHVTPSFYGSKAHAEEALQLLGTVLAGLPLE